MCQFANTIISKIQNRAIADGINGQILMNQILENFIENK
jgi:predicted DNA binding CopG/RHH family protein